MFSSAIHHSPVALALLLRRGSHRRRLGISGQFALQRVLLILRAAAQLIGREIGESEEHQARTDNGDEADQGSHRGYYRPPLAEPDFFMRICTND